MMSGLLERYGPYAVAMLFAIAATMIAGHIEPFDKTLVGTTASMGIIIVGFAGTQRTMLLTLGGSRFLRRAAKIGLYRGMLDYFMQPVWASLSMTIVSIIWLFVDKSIMHEVWKPWLAIWTGLLTLTLLLIIRNERLMRLVMLRFLRDQENR